jgi:hypothetical protein
VNKQFRGTSQVQSGQTHSRRGACGRRKTTCDERIVGRRHSGPSGRVPRAREHRAAGACAPREGPLLPRPPPVRQPPPGMPSAPGAPRQQYPARVVVPPDEGFGNSGAKTARRDDRGGTLPVGRCPAGARPTVEVPCRLLGPDRVTRARRPRSVKGPRRGGPGSAGRSTRHGDPRKAKTLRLTLGLAVAVLSRRHPGQDPFTGRNPEAAAGDVRPIHDLGHFAIAQLHRVGLSLP